MRIPDPVPGSVPDGTALVGHQCAIHTVPSSRLLGGAKLLPMRYRRALRVLAAYEPSLYTATTWELVLDHEIEPRATK